MTDKINKISVEYQRTTKIQSDKMPNIDKDIIWNYTEQLTIDRETESIEHIENIRTDCIVLHKYNLGEDVQDLLDNFDSEYLFENIVGNPLDVIETPDETKEYKLTIDFEKEPQKIITGTYDKKGLPENWAEFIKSVFALMRFYSFGEVFNPYIYKKVRRCKSDYIYCSVEFEYGYKSYYYLTDDDNIEIGDHVFVPAGEDNHTAIAQVVNIEYFSKEKVPLPIEKTKHIISKCTKEDLKNEPKFRQ